MVLWAHPILLTGLRMPILFLVIFVVMAGFAMLLPSLMYVLENLGASKALATPVLASYSFAQFVSGPIWGRWSDRLGRRPIILVSLCLALFAYGFLAFVADSVLLIFVGLTCAGLCAGNSAVLFAAVTDLTTEENRTKGMGVIGAGIGLAFTIGPGFGAILGGASDVSANISAPATASLIGCLLGLIVVASFFKETLHADHALEAERSRVGRIEAIMSVHKRPALMQMGLMMFVFTIALSMMEPIMSYLMRDRYAWGPPQMGPLFVYVGLILVVVQGGLIGRLSKRFGEKTLVRAGVVLMQLGLLAILYAPVVGGVFVGLTLTTVGGAIFNTSILSLASHRCHSGERGLVMGVFQSFQALGRSAGPLLTGFFYTIAQGLPFAAGALIMAIILVWSLSLYRRLEAEPRSASAAE